MYHGGEQHSQKGVSLCLLHIWLEVSSRDVAAKSMKNRGLRIVISCGFNQ